jgi:hypothetical protein
MGAKRLSGPCSVAMALAVVVGLSTDVEAQQCGDLAAFAALCPAWTTVRVLTRPH